MIPQPLQVDKNEHFKYFYHLSRDPHGLSTNPLLPFSCPRSYWMTCATARLQRDDLICHWNPQIQYFLLPSDKHVINMTTVMKFHSAGSKIYHGYFKRTFSMGTPVLDLWKINLEKPCSRNWISISNWIFTACLAYKNQFRNRFL